MRIAALLMVLVVTYFIWSWVREDRAVSAASVFCEQFKVGASMTDVAKAAKNEGDMKLRVVTDEHILVGYNGTFPYSRHFCTIDGQAGKVVKLWTSHPD